MRKDIFENDEEMINVVEKILPAQEWLEIKNSGGLKYLIQNARINGLIKKSILESKLEKWSILEKKDWPEEKSLLLHAAVEMYELANGIIALYKKELEIMNETGKS